MCQNCQIDIPRCYHTNFFGLLGHEDLTLLGSDPDPVPPKARGRKSP